MTFRTLHLWDLPPAEAIALQKRLAGELIRELPAGWAPKLVAGVDVTYRPEAPDTFTAGIVVLRLPGKEVIEEVTADHAAGMVYVPGLLSFREGPAILAAAARLTCVPDVFIFDGQGTAHPRRMGIAAHLGLWLDRPTLGCGKSLLCGQYKEPGRRRGASRPLIHKGEVVGRALRTRDGVSPVFVSPGHRMTLAAAVKLVLACGGGRRIPEPTRRAHILVNRTVGRTG